MSKIICSAAIRGAHKIVDRAEVKWKEAMDKWGAKQEVGFPNTGYYLPIIYGMLGIGVSNLGDMEKVLKKCRSIMPEPVREEVHLPYLAPALDAGMATLFAEELLEAIRMLEEPDFYTKQEEPAGDNIWLGPADDVTLRRRGIEFVDGTAPGFAAILGSVPDDETAAKIARELQEKSLYIFMGGQHNGKCFAQQLVNSNIQIGWPTRLVSFGPDTSAAVFALGFATRAAMAFGGVEPGNYRRILLYNKDRVFAFVLAFGTVTDEWYANAAGAINFGFPVIADTPIPEVLPTGICTYEHVVSNVPYDEIVNRAAEVRGLKVTVSDVPVPVSYGPAFEGERIRKEDLHAEFGGSVSQACELVTMKELDDVEDGKVEVIGPDIDELEAGSSLPLGVVVEVAGRKMQEDFEPILERQIHHFVNYAEGVMHIGQRDIAWYRIGTSAYERGLRIKHIGEILHAKLHQDFGTIFDKLQVKLYTREEDVKEIVAQARGIYATRDARIEGMTDEDTDPFYSCTLCQSFAPSHVCMVSPERTGLCGAYNWLDCKAANQIDPNGPNQPVKKGRLIDEKYGEWEGINEFVKKASRGKIEGFTFYSILERPMTTCGCCECVAAVLPMCNGFMTVNREFQDMTPCGMKFTTLAGTVGGGQSTPGFVGHSKYYICQRKFMKAEDGILRLVWMPTSLKEEIKDRFNKRAEEVGVPDLLDRIADETVGLTEEEILPFLEEKDHPALKLDPLF